ncbi:MBL fold metallo-hydrolase [Serratia plymuthica]|uniref:MBL fold metallo-hydrolase n=1 Tax=Serratia plymuthica TaxID=82996 RepID=A0A2X4V0S8_SERPL|nr:MBL fold metallo-hydrolase [Serratia plymuthica]QPS19453.1 MBL fold metallo-hydrolase [Serratia plymuthica]QPS61165.1 MBL fold metallo-hydrolase [Serratia plymuthica]RKS61771.1 glyoxylase-like metal-dependent hydrolase (beta-lactamase superfamily II) [Serratia plymuthica]CAI2457081.1 ribonuclease Z [Serratia plymuthica]SQI44763.1 ribonuclease Z [Serratia plymuthica]
MFWKRYLLGAALAVMALQATAAAPQVKTPSPGFYRIMLGSYEVTALSDGVIRLPVDKLLLNSTPQQIAEGLAEHHQSLPVVTSVNAYLINTGSKLVMIDAGAGKLLGDGLDQLVAHLRAAGYQPEQIDEIYLTHMHPDHLGGLTENGRARFPNALVRASQQDVDFWLSEKHLQQAKAEDKASFENAIAAIKPYQAAGHFKPFSNDGELSPGIAAFATHGHTPGHSVYQVTSQGKKLLLMGDLIHVAAVQFAHPQVAISFDSDAKAAVAQRLRVFGDSARQSELVGAAHLSFPGLGYLNKQGEGYSWVPLDYGAL